MIDCCNSPQRILIPSQQVTRRSFIRRTGAASVGSLIFAAGHRSEAVTPSSASYGYIVYPAPATGYYQSPPATNSPPYYIGSTSAWTGPVAGKVKFFGVQGTTGSIKVSLETWKASNYSGTNNTTLAAECSYECDYTTGGRISAIVPATSNFSYTNRIDTWIDNRGYRRYLDIHVSGAIIGNDHGTWVDCDVSADVSMLEKYYYPVAGWQSITHDSIHLGGNGVLSTGLA